MKALSKPKPAQRFLRSSSNRSNRRLRNAKRSVFVFACTVLIAVAFCAQALAQIGKDKSTSPLYGPRPELGSGDNGLPKVLDKVGIDQKLNEQIPLDLVFTDESGRQVTLGEYFNKGKPIVLTMVFYQCTMLCNEVLNGVTGSLKTLNFEIGREFDVVTVSIDPRETPQLARAKKDAYVARYGRTGAERGWHFLTGDQKSIDALANAVGFRFTYDEKTNQFAHAGGMMLLTPEGRLSHYFYGIEFAPRDLRLGLVEASNHKIGSPVDQLLLYCYHYDPKSGKYGLLIMSVVKIAGGITVVGIIFLILFLRHREGPEVRKQIEAGGAA